MANVSIVDVLMTKDKDPMEFQFDNLWIPPMHFYLSNYDIDQLRQIATSVRLSSKVQKKYDMIDKIMTSRGFKRFSGGTNRVVYRHTEDTRFLAKIAVDKVGMQDNPLEYKNQFLLKPFVAKMFYVSPCGTVGFAERVLPIKRKEEFKEVASDIFDIIVNKIIGLYVVEDIGTKFFMNWGIRAGFGPVLLDYPYVYELDGDKLWCTKPFPELPGGICNGEIDYDAGFNYLVCTRCGKRYLATNLRDNSTDNKNVIKKGGYNMMHVILNKGGKTIEPTPMDEVMERTPRTGKDEPFNGFGVVLTHSTTKENKPKEKKTSDFNGNGYYHNSEVSKSQMFEVTLNKKSDATTGEKVEVTLNKKSDEPIKKVEEEKIEVEKVNSNDSDNADIDFLADYYTEEDDEDDYKIPSSSESDDLEVKIGEIVEPEDPRPFGTQEDQFRRSTERYEEIHEESSVEDDAENDEDDDEEEESTHQSSIISAYEEEYDDGRPKKRNKKNKNKGSKSNFIPADGK